MAAADDWIEDARAVPIESEIARRGIALRKSGAERVGPCPICGGTDRFAINPAKGIWNCRGCGKGGDVIDLIQHLDGVDFNTAVETLTHRAKPNGKDHGRAERSEKPGPIVATYPYVAMDGTLLFQVTRHAPKDFRQRRPDGDGGWIAGTADVAMVPYHLPELGEAISNDRLVFICEGEKDVDNVIALGAPATCNPRGAGKWGNCKIDHYFAGARVVIIADRDPQTKNKKTGQLMVHDDGRPRFAGWDHAHDVAAHLSTVAVSVRVLDLKLLWPSCPDKADITDWINNAGGTIEQLYAFAEEISEWEPGDEVKPPAGYIAPDSVRILSTAEFVGTFRPPDYLVDGILQRGYLYALTGTTGHAKSAIALLIAELMGSSDRNAVFGKHKVDKGRVLYLVGENPTDLCMRVIGAHSLRFDDDPLQDQIFYIIGRLEIGERFAAIEAQVATIGELSLVIVDTSAAYFLGDEELNNKQMAEHARMLRQLTTLPGKPCVLALCHPIKNPLEHGQLLPRGGGAFIAEIDGNLTCWKKDNDLVELHHTKMRGPGFEPITIKLESISTTKLRDTKERILPTVRAVVVGQSEEDTQQTRQRDDEDRVLVEVCTHPGQTLSAMAEAIGWVNAHGEALKKRVHRAIERLEDPKRGPKLLKRNRDGWEATEEGKKTAAKAMQRFTSIELAGAQQTML